MAKFKKSDYKKTQNLYTIMGKIGDILFYPIILISLICVFAIFSSKADGKVPSILGFSMVTVSSGSMTKAGFDKNDVVFIHQKNSNSLRAGDIIAFYYASPGIDVSTLTLVQSYDIEQHKITKQFDAQTFNQLRAKPRTIQTKTIDQVSKTADIYFHRIVGIYLAPDGTIFYQTEGDSNAGIPDGYLTAETQVVGKYFFTPQVLRSAFYFVASPTGMFALIVAPLAVLMLLMLFSIIEQISRMNLEARVLRREIPFDDPESIKAQIGYDMELDDKVKFYASSDLEERNAVAQFLWGNLSQAPKQASNFHEIMNALKKLETNPDKYWLYFLGMAKSKRHKKMLHIAWKEWTRDEKMRMMIRKNKAQEQAQEKAKEQGRKIQGKSAPKRKQKEKNEANNSKK